MTISLNKFLLKIFFSFGSFCSAELVTLLSKLIILTGSCI